MYKHHRIAVVMSCLNEAGKIGRSIRTLRSVTKGLVDSIIVVDDGSTDETSQEITKAKAVLLKHPKNLGAGAGYRTAMLYTLEHRFDITVIMAGDDQDEPGDVHKLIKKIVDEGYDYVHGSRWLTGSRRINHPITRSILTRLYSVLFAAVTGFPSTDATNGFRAFRTNILKNRGIRLKQSWLNKYELEPYFFYHVVKLGYAVSEVPVTKRYHTKMKSNTKMIPFKSWWSILRPLIFLPLGMKR